MREAILGDLLEELARDTADVGSVLARARYRQRVMGIVTYVLLDAARWRPWMSTHAPLPSSFVSQPVAAIRSTRSPLRRADVGLLAVAFVVLGLGIVANTLLFATVRPGAQAVHDSSAVTSALGVVSLALALGSAACAAVLLCVGPRWVRRRFCRKMAEAEAGTH